MSKQAFKRVRREIRMEPVSREPLPAFAWPGGYPIVYLFTDGGIICPDCANENIVEIDSANRAGRPFNSHGGWAITGFDLHMDGDPELCDHCHKEIESAYGPVESV